MKIWIIQFKWGESDWARGTVTAPSAREAIALAQARCPDAEVDIVIAGETPALVV